MKRLLQNLAILVGTSALTFLLIEGGLRLVGFYPWGRIPDPTIGSVFIPHAPYRWSEEGFSQGRTNAAGWRDRDYTEAKPPGTIRILFCGDSFVEALHVNLDSTFHKRLERTMNASAAPGQRYQVIALGQSGIGTTVEYLMYKKWGVRYDPDVVCVLYFLNDSGDNWFWKPGQARQPFFVDEGDSLRLDNSFRDTPGFKRSHWLAPLRARSSLLTLFLKVQQQLRVRTRPTEREAGLFGSAGWYGDWNFHVPPEADSIPAFRLTEKILARFAEEVKRDGRRFVVVVAGGAEQEDPALLVERRRNPTFDPDKLARWLTSVGVRHGFEVLPLTPAFHTALAAGGPQPWCGVRPAFGHWNDFGHALAADAIAAYFAAHPPGRTPAP